MDNTIDIYLSDIIRDAIEKKRLSLLLPIIKEQDEIYDRMPHFPEKYFFYMKDVKTDYEQACNYELLEKKG